MSFIETVSGLFTFLSLRGIDNAQRKSHVKGTSLYLFYDRLQSMKRLKEVAQRSGCRQRFASVPPWRRGQTPATPQVGTVPLSLAEPTGGKITSQNTQRGLAPGSQGSQPQQRNPMIWVWHRNRGLLDPRVFSGLDPDAQKIQGPSFSKCHISLLDSCYYTKEGAQFRVKWNFLPAQQMTDSDLSLNRYKDNKNKLCC